MKEISKEINKYLMELDNCNNDRSEYDIMVKLARLTSGTLYDATHNRNGDSYYDLATNEMMNDIYRYLNRYINEHNDILEGTEFYTISLSTTNTARTLKLRMNIERGKFKNKSVQYMVNNFPRSALYYMLDLDVESGEEYVKYNRTLLKSEYTRFMNLRAKNPTYYLPYIQGIISGLNSMELY